MPDVEVQESVDVVQVKEEPLVSYDLGGVESSPQEVIEEVAMAVEAKDELHASYNLEPVEEPDQQEALVQQGVESSPQEVVEEVAMAVQVKDELHASYNLEPVEEPVESGQQEALVQQTEEIVNDESAVSETVEAIVMTPKDVDITCDVQTGEAPIPIVEAAEAVVMKDTPIDITCDGPAPIVEAAEAVVMKDTPIDITCDDPAPIVEAAEAVVMQDTPIELNCDTAVEVEVKKSSRRASPSVNKMDLVNIITHAAERKRRESRDSSVDSEGGCMLHVHCMYSIMLCLAWLKVQCVSYM